MSDDTTGQTGVLKTWRAQRLTEADRVIRTIRANFIEARGVSIPHQQAGYMRAILSLPSPTQNLAKWKETIYGHVVCAHAERDSRVVRGHKQRAHPTGL